MARIVTQEAALEDMQRLYDFLEQHDEATAVRAAKQIDKNISQLEKYPELVPPLNGEYRVMFIPFGRRSYSVAYAYDAAEDEVLILGIKRQREEFYAFEIECAEDGARDDAERSE